MLEVEKTFGESVDEVLRRMYVDENKSVKEISKEIGVGYVTTTKWLHKSNITARRIYFD